LYEAADACHYAEALRETCKEFHLGFQSSEGNKHLFSGYKPAILHFECTSSVAIPVTNISGLSFTLENKSSISLKIPMFQRNISPLSSGSKNKQSKKPKEAGEKLR
jgi:hypothetical protein